MRRSVRIAAIHGEGLCIIGRQICTSAFRCSGQRVGAGRPVLPGEGDAGTKEATPWAIGREVAVHSPPPPRSAWRFTRERAANVYGLR